MAALKRELSKAISALNPTQSFNVIFSQDQACKTFSPDLAAATRQNKDGVLRFLDDMVPGGTTDPLPGIDLAFRQKPEVVYLLTDGDFPDNSLVSRKIAALDAGGKVRIHTIAFVDADDRDTDFISLLTKIAGQTNGTFKRVLAD